MNKYLIRLIKNPHLLVQMCKMANSSVYTYGFYPTTTTNTFGAFLGNKLVAFASLACYHGFWCMRACYVDPAHRGNGLQRKLINARLKYLSKKYPNIRYVNVWAHEKNTVSINNLIACGFNKILPVQQKVYHDIVCTKFRWYKEIKGAGIGKKIRQRYQKNYYDELGEKYN